MSISKGNGNQNQPPQKGKKSSDNSSVPALIIGGALLGNFIVPGLGGAIVGGLLGGVLGNQSSDKEED